MTVDVAQGPSPAELKSKRLRWLNVDQILDERLISEFQMQALQLCVDSLIQAALGNALLGPVWEDFTEFCSQSNSRDSDSELESETDSPPTPPLRKKRLQNTSFEQPRAKKNKTSK